MRNAITFTSFCASVVIAKAFIGSIFHFILQAGKDFLVSVVGTVGESSRRTRVEVRVRIEGPSGIPEDKGPFPPKVCKAKFLEEKIYFYSLKASEMNQ